MSGNSAAYGAKHRLIRAALLRKLPALVAAEVMKPSPEGCLCPRCGLVMKHPQPLDCGHSDPDRKLAGLPGDRLEHAACNRQAGASKLVHPKGHVPSRDW